MQKHIYINRYQNKIKKKKKAKRKVKNKYSNPYMLSAYSLKNSVEVGAAVINLKRKVEKSTTDCLPSNDLTRFDAGEIKFIYKKL